MPLQSFEKQTGRHRVPFPSPFSDGSRFLQLNGRYVYTGATRENQIRGLMGAALWSCFFIKYLTNLGTLGTLVWEENGKRWKMIPPPQNGKRSFFFPASGIILQRVKKVSKYLPVFQHDLRNLNKLLISLLFYHPVLFLPSRVEHQVALCMEMCGFHPKPVSVLR